MNLTVRKNFLQSIQALNDFNCRSPLKQDPYLENTFWRDVVFVARSTKFIRKSLKCESSSTIQYSTTPCLLRLFLCCYEVFLFVVCKTLLAHFGCIKLHYSILIETATDATCWNAVLCCLPACLLLIALKALLCVCVCEDFLCFRRD